MTTHRTESFHTVIFIIWTFESGQSYWKEKCWKGTWKSVIFFLLMLFILSEKTVEKEHVWKTVFFQLRFFCQHCTWKSINDSLWLIGGVMKGNLQQHQHLLDVFLLSKNPDPGFKKTSLLTQCNNVWEPIRLLHLCSTTCRTHNLFH